MEELVEQPGVCRQTLGENMANDRSSSFIPHIMNTHIILALGLLMFPLASVTAQVQPPPPQINVSGSAEIKVVPDEIELNVEIETRHGRLDVAKRENDEKISRVLAFLKRSGVAEKDIQTDFVGIRPHYENDSKAAKIYSVEKTIGIKVRQVGNFETVLSGLLTNGVNTVHGIQFRTSELRKHRDSARQMAIRAAREKADALAGELGVKRGRVYQITENSGGGWWNQRGQAMLQNTSQNVGEASGSADGTFSVGQISVSATVNVSFLIE